MNSEILSGQDELATTLDNSIPCSKLRCVDLFAGAGGFSLAAKLADIKVVAAVELNKYACSTYRENLIDKCDAESERPVLYEKNIMDLSPEILRKSHFSQENPCDIVLGGPPCQGFSVHRINSAGVDDPRNELILRYFALERVLQPKVFLMENVPGILWPRHQKFLSAFMAEGEKTGYEIIGPLRLDARDYGVPQRRVRVFILGVRKGVNFDSSVWPPRPTHGDSKALNANPTLTPWVNASNVFSLPDIPYDENDCHMNHTEALIEVFRATPINGSRKDSNRILPCHQNHSGHNDVYGRINLGEPGPTMTTACINPSKGRFVHPTEHHGITVRQAARFQTFPDSFLFKGGITAAGTQIGNAVPVDLGKVLLEAVTKGLANGFNY